MPTKIRVVILDDHPGIINGYLYLLSNVSDIQVVATLTYGEALLPTLEEHPVDVLLLDVQLPTNLENRSPYPILHVIPTLLNTYPNLAILVISMYNQRALIKAVLDAGASGYILKDDQGANQELATVIHSVADGGIYLSQRVYQMLLKPADKELPLSSRQLEALSLCAAYPDASMRELAGYMNIEGSTLRTFLSSIYLKLGVRTRAAAVARARQLELLSPETNMIDIQKLEQ